MEFDRTLSYKGELTENQVLHILLNGYNFSIEKYYGAIDRDATVMDNDM